MFRHNMFRRIITTVVSIVIVSSLSVTLTEHSANAALRDVEGIAAIVNDEVISLYDVDQRVNLFLTTSGIPNTPETVDRLRTQVLRALVDEKLQLQEAKTVEIAIENDEIDQSMSRLAQQSNMTRDEIVKFLDEKGIIEDTLRSQIEAELAWSQYVRRRYGGRISISDADIEEQYARALEALDQPRYLLSEILINPNGFQDNASIEQTIQEIVKQLQAGVDFGAIARQISSSPSAARGGDMGWVYANQLDPKLQQVITSLAIGQISNPVSTPAGISIIALRNKQEGGGKSPLRNQFDLLQIIVNGDAQKTELASVRAEFKHCTQAEENAKKISGANVTRTGLQPLGAFDTGLQRLVESLDAGQLTDVINSGDNFVLFAVCDRKDDQGVNISKDTIYDNLYSQRLSMLSRRHLRNLRRDSVVEYR